MRPDIVIVDTSLAVKWVAQEPDSLLALALLSEWSQRAVLLAAPALLAYEVANAIHQKVRSSVLPASAAPAVLANFHATGIAFRLPNNATIAAALSTRALEIARAFGLGATYDTQFLALAEHEDCEYWTADRRFFETARQDHPRVKWLGAYQPPQAQPAGPTPTP
ncbi:MAG TPA: type II toxin-antitoxin system VapC family toxin [Ktedonobacterales bacterium]|nr:type II toxin-antitoxin system VapC family toxin [Ktedonobacterales bacterium]